jgi:hypothetical protein
MSFRKYRHYEPGEFYVIFADTAWGGLDYCAAQFLCKDKLDVPVVYHAQVLASDMTPLIHAEAERIYDKTNVQPVVCYETNNGGTAELERLARLNRLGKYTIYQQKLNVGTTDVTSTGTRLGFTTNAATRPKMLADLKEMVDSQMLRIYDKPTITEMFSFVIKQGNSSKWKAEAENGAHDDLIMSLAGAVQLYQTEQKPETYDDFEIEQPVNFMVG